MEIIQSLSLVANAVGAVTKSERNTHQGFNFRGIDAVVNAVSPAMRENGVVVFPRVISSEYDIVTVGAKQTQMGHARVTVEYAFYACDGSNVSAIVAAESMDSGDKATAKAMSVAFRTALLQVLCLPTDETDPDAETFTRTYTPDIAPFKPTPQGLKIKPKSDMAEANGVTIRGTQHGPIPDWLVLEAFQAGVSEVYDNRDQLADNPKRPWFKATSGGKDAKAFWAPKGTPLPVIASHEDDMEDLEEEEPF